MREADVQRAALGATTVEPVVIDHPLSTLTSDEIAGRAAAATNAVIHRLTDGTV